MSKNKFPKIVVILGPTATGKSDLAVYIAKKFKGEVISADSRQVYEGMDIGSGKITKKEMENIPHHLLDIIDPKKVYNAEQFKRDGTKAIQDILDHKKLPIICGGTGFYIDALVFDEQFPDVPPNKKLRKELEKKSVESLMKEIRKLDPVRAKALDPYNKVRIIRAIEIARVLGKVPKVKRTKQYEALFIGLTLDRSKLRERIHARLEKRMKAGMIREISNLHKNGVSWKRLYDFGLEYRYVSLYLQKKLSKEEMLTKLEQEICQFSKRQMQWFKRNKNIKWFAPFAYIAVEKIVKKFLK
ncbi:MAG: tRNA (adenosine(37)-N6)-dimethylallyltransferase MiaA [Patescibacteria group bacterium]